MGAVRDAVAAHGRRLVATPPGVGVALERRRDRVERLVVVPEPTAPLGVLASPTNGALVLGSTQDLASLDAPALARRGLATVRRRSGGGAVVVEPGAQVWLDLFVPATDEAFERDVSAQAELAGAIWRDALVAAGVGAEELSVHRGGVVASQWSRRWCFSGIGPGEVLLGGRKLVGVSQRRNRAGAWLFTMALVRHDPRADAGLLALGPAERDALASELAARTAVLPLAPSEVESALASRLARGLLG